MKKDCVSNPVPAVKCMPGQDFWFEKDTIFLNRPIRLTGCLLPDCKKTGNRENTLPHENTETLWPHYFFKPAWK
jgi:hypothetical protein